MDNIKINRDRLFDLLLRGLPVAFFMVDADLKIIEFNHVAQDLTGWERTEAIGTPCSLVLNSSLCGQLCPLKESARLGKSFVAREAVISNKFGEEIPIIFSSASVLNDKGEMEAGVELFRDASEDSRIQMLRNHIISVFAHDIKTPVAVTGGFVQRLIQGKAGPISPKGLEYLEMIRKENARVEGLIGRLLGLLRMEGGQTRLFTEPVSLDAFLYKVWETFRPKADEKNIKIAVETDEHLPILKLDQEQMERVFTNLLDNAVKYSPTDTTITIKAWKEGRWAIIEVRDQGIGIPPEDLPHIFDYFYRSMLSSGYAQGTGLGLASARAIVEAHGGRIWAKSWPGKGSSFFIRLPIDGSSPKGVIKP